MLDAYKEMDYVFFGEDGIKFHSSVNGPGCLCFGAHWHDRIELLYIQSGVLEAYLDNEHYTATAGQTVIISPRMLHCGYSGNQGVTYWIIAFDAEKFCNATVASQKYIVPLVNAGIRFCPIADHPAVAKTVQELLAFLAAGAESNPLCAIGKVYELLGLFFKHCSTETRQFHKTDTRFSKILDYVNNHYTEDISAKNVSEKFGYDETYFCRRFKEATGITTMKYIRLLRLEKAQKLLLNSQDEIKTIAWQCGFSDISYFSNCFKQQYGISPSAFRIQG